MKLRKHNNSQSLKIINEILQKGGVQDSKNHTIKIKESPADKHSSGDTQSKEFK